MKDLEEADILSRIEMQAVNIQGIRTSVNNFFNSSKITPLSSRLGSKGSKCNFKPRLDSSTLRNEKQRES